MAGECIDHPRDNEYRYFHGRTNSLPEMNGHGHEFGHEFVSESVSEADSDTDTKFLRTSDTHSDKVMTSDTDTTSDTGMSENLGHGLGHRQTSDTRVRSSLLTALM